MLTYNKARKAEFFELQRKMDADSLEAARLAYMRNEATEEQIALVEEMAERERTGRGPGSFKMPSLLGPPSVATGGTKTGKSVEEAATWPGSGGAEGNGTMSRPEAAEAEGETQTSGFMGWLFSGMKKEEERRPNRSTATSTTATASVAESVRTKANEAFERERERQRTGGPLDQIGVQGTTPTSRDNQEAKRKSWW